MISITWKKNFFSSSFRQSIGYTAGRTNDAPDKSPKSIAFAQLTGTLNAEHRRVGLSGRRSEAVKPGTVLTGRSQDGELMIEFGTVDAIHLQVGDTHTLRLAGVRRTLYSKTVQARLDQHPEKMTIRRQTAEHPFGTIKDWMGATHFLTKRLPKVATEMALNVLAYNMKRVMALIGVAGLLEALAT
jgi:hypothetical protein